MALLRTSSTWRRVVAQGALTAAGSGEGVVPASDYRALQSQVRELQRLLGRKTLEAEILKETREHATGSKNGCGCRRRRRTVPDEALAEVIGVSRSNLIERMRERAKERIGRPPLPDDKLVAEIKAVIAESLTYGYRRVHAILARRLCCGSANEPRITRAVMAAWSMQGRPPGSSRAGALFPFGSSRCGRAQ